MSLLHSTATHGVVLLSSVYLGDPLATKSVLTWARRQGATSGSAAGLPEVGGQMLQLLIQEELLGVGFNWHRGGEVAALFCKCLFIL